MVFDIRAVAVCVGLTAPSLGCASAPGPSETTPPPAAPDEPPVPAESRSTADDVPSTDIYLGQLDTSVEPWTLTELRNVTARSGYDNQPHFDTNASFYYTSVRAGQSDIYRYSIEDGQHAQLTSTPSNEYSATSLPHGQGFSVVRELDGVQELWRHAPDGAPAGRMFEALDAIGYHLWLDGTERAAFFLVGESEDQHRLVLAAAPGAELSLIARGGVGRCMATLGTGALSYVERSDSGGQLVRYTLASGEREPIVAARAESEDYAWIGTTDLLMGESDALWRWNTDAGWSEVELRAAPDEARPSKMITRIAVSPDHQWVALVEADPSE